MFTVKNKGVRTAISAVGQQNKTVEHMKRDEIPSHFLRMGQRYTVTYGSIPITTEEIVSSSPQVVMTIVRESQNDIGADLLSQVDLVLHTSSDIGSVLERIIVYCGGSELDKWSSSDIATEIETSCAVFGKQISTEGGLTIVPLTLAPFNKNLLFPCGALTNHKLRVDVTFKEYQVVKTELWGHSHVLSDARIMLGKRLDWAVYQNQWQNLRDDEQKGVYPLHFNHPVHMLYFWGFDESLIKSIRFTVNKNTYGVWQVSHLRRAMALRGFSAVKPLMLFLGDDKMREWPTSRSSVNFSRIDYAELHIETEEILQKDKLHAAAVAQQFVRVQEGLCGLIYSK